MLQVGEMLDLIVRNLEGTKLFGMFKTGYFCQCIVGDVEFLELYKIIETRYLGQAV